MKKPCPWLLLTAIGWLAGPLVAHAWGPHSEITRAALAVVTNRPEAAAGAALLGADNLRDLATYCWMLDSAGDDGREYYPNDYLLLRDVPIDVGYFGTASSRLDGPDYHNDWRHLAPLYFARTLQALRTETPVNAARQMGALLHSVQDAGCPAHAAQNWGMPHTLCESGQYLRNERIGLADYAPQLLGHTDAEALAGLRRRMDSETAFAIARCDQLVALIKEKNISRDTVEPPVLEAADETARATADVVYTLLVLGTAPQPPGAGLEGTISAPVLPTRELKAARVILVDDTKLAALDKQGRAAGAFFGAATDYSTLAVTSSNAPDGWAGRYAFRNLPPGKYRVLAERTGSDWALSAPVVLETGATSQVNVPLAATRPAGNLIRNPDGALACMRDGPEEWIHAEVPCPWLKKTLAEGGADAALTNRMTGPSVRSWVSQPAVAVTGVTFRCGAVLKDPAAIVGFLIRADNTVRMELLATGTHQPPELVRTYNPVASVSVYVFTDQPLTSAVERVWLAPAQGPVRP